MKQARLDNAVAELIMYAHYQFKVKHTLRQRIWRQVRAGRPIVLGALK